jgi:hypothetical protein
MNENNFNISELQKSVNLIFECHENMNGLQSELSAMRAEMILIDHLTDGIKRLDVNKSFDLM